MKRLILMVLLITMISVSIALAGIKKGDIQKDFQYTQNVTVTHKVVSGYAAAQLGPNFYDNDWDEIRQGSWSNLTQEDINYLKTISGLSNGIWYYIDLTDKTGAIAGVDENTMPFQDFSEFISEGDITINIDHTYQLVLQVYDYSPIVLDLNNDKKIDVAYNYWLPHAPKFFTQNVVKFDITGDMVPDLVEWVINSNDGLLVEPGVKKVKSALDLFGTAGGYSDGYEKLATYDKDKNGFVEGKELEGFKIWIDKNQNGVCEDNELLNISEFNIKRLSVNHNGKYVSYYETNDGQKRIMWDWWPAAIQVKKIATE
ncbi:MAG: hypothetical protein N2485_07210 [bacterium]|nr:hypothetical protein [bacterium]